MIAETKKRKEVTVLDVTIGPVISVINGNTFTMQVTHIGNHNVLRYKNYETIRIKNRTAANLSSLQGITDRQKLLNLLNGKKVRCQIHRRDEYNVLIANVEYYT